MFFILLLILLFNIIFFIKVRKIKINKQNINNNIKEELNSLLNEKEQILKNISDLKILKENKEKEINNINNFIDTTKKSFCEYCDILDKEYTNKDKEWDNYIKLLENNYNSIQEKTLKEIEKNKNILKDIINTKDAAIKAQLKEEEIKNNKNFYCPKINEDDLKDIKILKEIEYKINNKRLLRMLIWQNFYQKPINQVCINILGSATQIKSGIYKITNQIDNRAYIGQAVDIATRWKTHAKCGLGIDTPQNNKLYKAMYEYGLENFSFEVLEFCSKEDLNKKESFYIDLYQTNKFGYNLISGSKNSTIL